MVFAVLDGFGQFASQGLRAPSGSHGVQLPVCVAYKLCGAEPDVHLPMLHLCAGGTMHRSAVPLCLEGEDGWIPLRRLQAVNFVRVHATVRRATEVRPRRYQKAQPLTAILEGTGSKKLYVLSKNFDARMHGNGQGIKTQRTRAYNSDSYARNNAPSFLPSSRPAPSSVMPRNTMAHTPKAEAI